MQQFRIVYSRVSGFRRAIGTGARIQSDGSKEINKKHISDAMILSMHLVQNTNSKAVNNKAEVDLTYEEPTLHILERRKMCKEFETLRSKII